MRSAPVFRAGISIVIVAAGFFLVVALRKSPPTAEHVMARYASVQQELEAIVATTGPRSALDRLAAVAASDTELAGLCHGLSHAVGHAAQKKLGFTGALALQDDVCGSGYVHGVIEQELSVHIDDFEHRFRTMCPADDPRCFHGLGHGLMFVTDNDLPDSLEHCRTFAIPFQRIQCAEGVFMENFEADDEAHPSDYLYPAEPYRTCRDQPEPEKGICTFYFPRYFLRVHPSAFADLITFCGTLPRESADACIKGAGSAAMKSFVLEPEKALNVCLGVPEDERSFCVDGLLSYSIVHYASIVPAEKFCHERLEPLWNDICKKSLAEGRRAYRGT